MKYICTCRANRCEPLLQAQSQQCSAMYSPRHTSACQLGSCSLPRRPFTAVQATFRQASSGRHRRSQRQPGADSTSQLAAGNLGGILTVSVPCRATTVLCRGRQYQREGNPCSVQRRHYREHQRQVVRLICAKEVSSFSDICIVSGVGKALARNFVSSGDNVLICSRSGITIVPSQLACCIFSLSCPPTRAVVCA